MKGKKFIKTIVSVTLGALSATCLGLGLTACNKGTGEEPAPEHNWKTEWSYDETNHWHECADENCDLVNSAAPHVYDDENDTDCNTCGYVRTVNSDNPDNPDNPDTPDTPDTPPAVEYDFITTVWDANAAAETYGSGTATTEDITIGKFTFAKGVYFTNGGVNTQGKDVTVEIDGISCTLSFKGQGQSSSTVTQYTLFKDGTDVTPSDWATSSKDKRAFTAENLTTGTYVIKTSASALITELTVVEKVEKSEIVSIQATPAKTAFLQGEAFAATGLNVHGITEKGAQRLLRETDYEVISSEYDKDVSAEYTITVKLKDSEIKTTYSVKVYAVNSLNLYTVTTSGINQKTLQQVYLKNSTALNLDGLTVKATGTCGNDTANPQTFVLKAADYTAPAPDFTTVGTKTVEVKLKANESVKTSFTIEVVEPRQAENGEITVTVGETGKDFKTVTQAITYLGLLNLQSSVIKTVSVESGTYNEKVYINLPNVHLVGVSETAPTHTTDNGVVITFDGLAGDVDATGATYGTFGSHTVGIGSAAYGFAARNITFKNEYNTYEKFNQSKTWLQQTYGNGDTQAVALRVDSSKATFYNCKMTSYHDTLLANVGNHYFEKCWIEGHTDYIFGTNSNMYFFDCDIFSIGDGNNKNGGYVVANRPETANYVCVFNGCRFDADSNTVDETVALGRPWGTNMKMVTMNSSISDKFSTKAHTEGTSQGERYCTMNGEPNPAYMMEYNNSGAGAKNETVANTQTYLSAAQAAAYDTAKLKDILGFVPGGEDLTVPFDFTSLENAANTKYTEANPAKPFGENALSIVGSFRQQKGAGIQIVVGSVISLHVKGKITVEWYGGNLGTAANGRITYNDGFATLTIIDDAASTNGIYIKSITVDGGDIQPDTQKLTVTVYGEDDVALTDTILVYEGEKITLAQVQALLSEGTIDKVYTSSARTTEFNFNTPVTANTPLYITLKNYTLPNNADYDFNTVSADESGTGSASDPILLFDGNVQLITGSRRYTDGTGIQLGDGSVIKVKLDITTNPSARALVSFKWHGGQSLLGNDSIASIVYDFINGWATITIDFSRNTLESNGSTTMQGAYLYNIYVTYVMPYEIGDSVDLLDSSLNLTAGNKAVYEGLTITAGTDKFQKNSGYIHAGAGSTISFYVGNGITADNMQVLLVEYQGNETQYNNYFTYVVNNGVATVTIGSNTLYIKAIKLVTK